MRAKHGGWPAGQDPNLDPITEHISATERRAAMAERQTVDRFTAAFLAAKTGAVFRGRISGVSRFGVFVIETKNMKGWIFGDPRHKRWTQQLFRRRHGFQNPLHQNYLHLITLKSLLGLADHQLHSIVYFIGDCTFKTPMPENAMRRGLVSYIKSKTTPVLSTADVDRIVDTIQQGRLTASWQTHRQHVTQLKARYAGPSANHVSTRAPVRQSVANPPSQSVSPPDNPPPLCPRCGSTMVLRGSSCLRMAACTNSRARALDMGLWMKR